MLRKIKSFFKKNNQEVPGIEAGCTVIYSMSQDQKPIISFNLQRGREREFVSLLFMLHTGCLKDFTVQFLEQTGKTHGVSEYTKLILTEWDKLCTLTSYNAQHMGLDAEDPVVCPTSVFGQQKTEERHEK